MSWQFIIIDYTTNPAGVSTPIAEPVGWDGINLHLKRDENWHGFFSYVDDSFGGLQFDGAGAAILRNAYYNFGINADVRLSISYSCGDDDQNELSLYVGSFFFSSFKDYLADRCYVECSLEANRDFMNFKNRVDQQVDLDSLVSFDELPSAQTVTTPAWFQSGTNIIRTSAVIYGLQPGSILTVLSGTTLNPGPFTVVSSQLDNTNVVANVVDNSPVMQTLSVLSTFATSPNTIMVQQVLPPLAIPTNGSLPTIVITDAGNNNNNQVYQVNHTYTYFDYTLYDVTPLSNTINAGTSECTINAIFTVSSQPSGTLITVLQGLTPEPGSGATEPMVTFQGQWFSSFLKLYPGLNEVITIPSKVITETSMWQSDGDSVCDTKIQLKIGGIHSNGSTYYSGAASFTPGWPAILTEIDTTSAGTGEPNTVKPDEPDTTYSSSNPPDPLLNFNPMTIPCAGTGTLEINVSGRLSPAPNVGLAFTDKFSLMGVLNTTFSESAAFLNQDLIYAGNGGNAQNNSKTGSGTLPTGVTFNYTCACDNNGPGIWIIDFTYRGTFNFPAITPGSTLWIVFNVAVNNTDAFNSGKNDHPIVTFNGGSYFKFQYNTVCEDTPCSVYMINEVMSRCVESYTNGNMYVYSDYFGRTDAKPFPSLVNGCGGLEAITNGLRIRGCVMPDGTQQPKFSISMKEVFDSLDAIHNIGMGLEVDTASPANVNPYNPTANLRIRVEPFEWFFPTAGTPLLTCDNVFKYSREVQPSLIPTVLKCGYQQFQTWSNNGLFDIYSDRTYRMMLTDHVTVLDKTCKWMASDYAIEYTRRTYGNTTADSRYDSNTFILCLQGNYSGAVEFVTNNCFMLYDPLRIIQTGWNIRISDTGYNQNGGNLVHINSIQPSNAPDIIIVFVNFTVNTEIAPGANIRDHNNNTITYTLSDGSPGSFDNVPAVFIGDAGAIMLDTLPIYGSAPGDLITITNATISTLNTTYTVSLVVQPLAAQSTDQEPVPNTYFPMMMLPSALNLSGASYSLQTGCTVKDITNKFYTVEQGNIINSSNILNPQTVLNYRISPAHNAMRHFREAAMAFRNPANAQMAFTGGTGNFYGIGQLPSGDSCALENGVLSEGANISMSNFANPTQDAYPLFYPETIKFEYPLSWAQFVGIQANPYGLVQFFHASEGMQEGWISELQYKPYTGMAEFTLYLKIPS